MVHHRFDLEAVDGADGIRRASGGGGTGGGIDRMSRALQIPPTEVFEIITQHRCGQPSPRGQGSGGSGSSHHPHRRPHRALSQD
ncbi:unnamed protein product [Ectocarpus sp. 12 AP-2014]